VPLRRLTCPNELAGPFVDLRGHEPMRSLNLHIFWDQHAPTLGALLMPTHPNLFGVPFPCVFPCISQSDSSWVCRWGHATSPTSPCCQGSAGPLLWRVPKSPHPYPNATQVSIIYRKESEAFTPLLPHAAIVCPSCSWPCLYDFVLPTNQMLLVFSFHDSTRGACVLNGCRERLYTLDDVIFITRFY